MAGRYLFRLAATPFDAGTLDDGAYDLVVTVADSAGNRDVERLRFTVEGGLAGPARVRLSGS